MDSEWLFVHPSNFAFEAYVAVHAEDRKLCDEVNAVRLRHYSATNKTYIGLRKDETDALERAETLFGKICDVDKDSFVLLRVQFSSLGVTKYTTKVLGPEESFASMLHKITYQYTKDNSGIDYNEWAFHGDLPLQETTADGDVLISSTWMKIGDRTGLLPVG
jgi:hypothetical protein